MSKTAKFPLPVYGADVMSPETDLKKGTVRTAVNVDIDRVGGFCTRNGYVRRSAATGLHSLHYAAQKGWLLIAQDGVVCRMDADTYALTPLLDMRSPAPVSYTEYNGNVYFASRSAAGWIPSDAVTARYVGAPAPGGPTVSVSSGTLRGGKYAVAISVVDDRGEESPLSEVVFTELPEAGGGIRLTGLPQQLGSTVYVYITPPDGDVLRFAAEFPAVFPMYVVTEMANGGQPYTQYLSPLPGGDIIRWFNGRLYTAVDGRITYSEPLRPHLYNAAHNWIPISGRLAFLEPVVDGIYYGDSRGVWFLAGGDPTKFEQRLVSTCRAVRFSSVVVPPEHFPEDVIQSEFPVAVWLSTSGYVVGTPGGKTIELQADRIKVPPGLSGRTAFLIRNGRRQVVTPVNSTAYTTDVAAQNSVVGP